MKWIKGRWCLFGVDCEYVNAKCEVNESNYYLCVPAHECIHQV